MGFYCKHVLPRMIDLAMRNPEATRLREEWLSRATGDVLEVGIGSGLNLRFYSSKVRCVYGVDPSIELQRKARERLAGAPLEVRFFTQSAEDPVALPHASIDTVVVTWSLCSIADATGALRQIKPVLKPEGGLIFLEHGLAPDQSVAAWQHRLTPLWKRAAGGCHLNRRIDTLISGAGFRSIELRTCYLRGLRPMTYTYQGFAQRMNPDDARPR